MTEGDTSIEFKPATYKDRQYRKPPVRILCLPKEGPGTVLVDARGQHYCAVANRAGKFGGIRKMTDKDVELSKKLSIPARPSMTLAEMLEIVTGAREEEAR
jgi:hypothetical protein